MMIHKGREEKEEGALNSWDTTLFSYKLFSGAFHNSVLSNDRQSIREHMFTHGIFFFLPQILNVMFLIFT